MYSILTLDVMDGHRIVLDIAIHGLTDCETNIQCDSQPGRVIYRRDVFLKENEEDPFLLVKNTAICCLPWR